MGFKARGKRKCGGCGSTDHDKRTCPGLKPKVTKTIRVQPRAAPASLADRIESAVNTTVEEYKKEQIQDALRRLTD